MRDPHKVDADPTKKFFISVITRDIGLRRAILDLVDNSVDGAVRLRGYPGAHLEADDKERRRYEGLRIQIRLSESDFVIEDNCGGIPIDVARYYAFRFGHSDTAEEKRHAPSGGSRIGLFGIGMKRALFKLGDEFEVESITTASRFLIRESVPDWLSKPEWDLRFAEFDESARDADDSTVGTRIHVKRLHRGVVEEFMRAAFATELRTEVRSALQTFLASGLSVLISTPTSTESVIAERPELLVAADIRPLATTESFDFGEGEPVVVRMYVGVSDPNLRKAGWYVYCNGRLVLDHDQSMTTGWGARAPVRVPRFHDQFKRFRGYVFFDSSDTAKLPWNTTKTGVDEESPLFRSVRDLMIRRMKPVTDMLNALRREEDVRRAVARTPVKNALSIATPQPVRSVEPSPAFSWPQEPESTPPIDKEVLIRFARPAADVSLAMKYFGVGSADLAGERAFEYWLRETRGR